VVLEYFHPWPNSSGFWVAAALGWYRDADLDVDLRTFDPLRGDGLDYLLRRECELAVLPSDRLLARRSAGQPVYGIAAINHRAPETLRTTAAMGISRPSELAGRRVALDPTPVGVALLRHLVSSDGGDPDAVALVDSGVRALAPTDIVDGTADAILGGFHARDVLFGGIAEDELVWPADEIGGLPHHGYLLAAHEDRIAGEPELLRTFLAVTERGFQTAAVDPELTLAVLERVLPHFAPAALARSLRLIAPTWRHEGRWGEQRDALLVPYASWLRDQGILQGEGPSLRVTTNELLPALAR
jgi:NitT/TauT family transport system substrate-binding protein